DGHARDTRCLELLRHLIPDRRKVSDCLTAVPVVWKGQDGRHAGSVARGMSYVVTKEEGAAKLDESQCENDKQGYYDGGLNKRLTLPASGHDAHWTPHGLVAITMGHADQWCSWVKSHVR